jgi:Flp pilus assembly protein TadG
MGMSKFKKFAHDERGVSAVVAAVALVGIFAGATLSVDAGNLWQSRRNIITATDASALAMAGELALTGGSECTPFFVTVLENNAGADVYEPICNVNPHPEQNGWGYVTVEARKPVEVRFGAVLGLGDTNAYSMSAAQYGAASSARGLRPIAFCVNNEHVGEWRDLKANPNTQEAYDALKGDPSLDSEGRIKHPTFSPQGSYLSFGVVHRMYFKRSIDDGKCGEYDGNWGWLDFNGNELPNGTKDAIVKWLVEGYDGEVNVHIGPPCPQLPGGGDAETSEDGCVPASTGTLSNSVMKGLHEILNKPVHILIVNEGTDCGGTPCTLTAFAFLGVILRGYDIISHPDLRYFDFEFTNIQVSGRCCDAPPGADLGARAVRLCAVDHDSIEIEKSERCGDSA